MYCCGSAQKDELLVPNPGKRSSPGSSVQYHPDKVLNRGGLELVQVQVVFRHGARTPLNYVQGLPEAIYERHLGLDLPEMNIPYQVVNLLNGRPVGDSAMEQEFKDARLKGGCRASVLTTVGQKNMFDLGKKIKDTYLAALDLNTYSRDLVRARSSHIDRTLKSLRCVLVGIFGRLKLSKIGPIKLHVKDIWDEDIFPNKLSCPALRLSVNLTLASLDSIPDYTNDKRMILRALGLPIIGHLDFSCIKDDVSCRLAHAKPYPQVLEGYKATIELQSARVLRAITTGRIEGSPNRDDVLMMSIGRLLFTFLAEMEDVVCGVIKPRLYLYAGHDTTLTPTLESLGLPQVRWPPFGASLIFELYRARDVTDGKQYFVRVLYCWEEQQLPCYEDSLIPFSVFRRSLSQFTVSPAEFRSMCSSSPF